MALLWPNAEVFRAVLPEMLVNSELRDLYYQQVLVPTFAIGEQFFQSLIESGEFRQIDISLAIRTIASTTLGLLVLQLLGDQEIAQRWEELPETITTLMFDGLYKKKGADGEQED
jgi:TetR/AcrR family fatty acid metabolism transcriptional regulator